MVKVFEEARVNEPDNEPRVGAIVAELEKNNASQTSPDDVSPKLYDIGLLAALLDA